jgi:hypothetical protein
VLVAGLLLLGAAAPALAQGSLRHNPFTRQGGEFQDTGYVDAVIRLDIENGPSAVVPALVLDTTLLLPLRQFLAMAEIRVEAFVLRDSAVAMLEPGHIALRFLPGAKVLTRGANAVPYDTLDVVWWDGDLFVATGLLDRLLGLNTGVEWSNLSAMVGRSASLPVIQRARRERRHQMLYRGQLALNVLEIPLRERTVDGAVLTWSLTAATRGQTDELGLDLGLGAGLLGGSAELRPQLWSTHGESGVELLGSWTRVWPRGQWVRQLRIGDVQSGGRRARLMEGAMITNAPFIRSSEFDVEQFVGTVPTGWEVELYDSGRLLAFADADAIGAFRVPLQLRYGQNPFDLVLYGPAGETVRQRRTIRVPFSRLPDGHLEYAVSGGRCRYDPCHGLLSADARYGLSSHVTVQGGWDAIFQDVGGTLWQPYAVVSAAPLPALGITGEAVANGHLRAAASYEPTTDLRVDAGYTSYAKAGARYSGTLGEATRSEASLFWRPGWMNGAMFFQGTGVHSAGPILTRTLERLSATTRMGYVRYSLGILHDALDAGSAAITRSFAIDASADAVMLGPWPWLRTSAVQGQIAVEPARGLTALRAALGRRVARSVRMDAALAWFRTAGYSLELGFSTARAGPRAGTRTRLSSKSGSEALTYANGSVALDPRARQLKLGDVADLGRAGISGILFRDDNGNGRRDSGEPGLAGIPVRVGGWPAETDAGGRFSTWGLMPSELLQIDVDSLSFADPQLILPAPVIQVRPSPNAFGAIEVPVVVGAEVSGYVVFRDEGLAGMPVVLRELNTGAEITTITFSDGGFYRAAVPPGEYEVTLPDAVLERLQAFAPPLSIFVPPGAGEKRYLDLSLRLEPRP